MLADRLAVWSERLGEPDELRATVLAEDDGLVGFANTYLEHDPVWGSLLDNLHVAGVRRRTGVGTKLLARSAQSAAARGAGLYLWVLEQNVEAQAFYEARGGTLVERTPVTEPGGVAGRLVGSPAKLRYSWPEPRLLADPG